MNKAKQTFDMGVPIMDDVMIEDFMAKTEWASSVLSSGLEVKECLQAFVVAGSGIDKANCGAFLSDCLKSTLDHLRDRRRSTLKTEWDASRCTQCRWQSYQDRHDWLHWDWDNWVMYPPWCEVWNSTPGQRPWWRLFNTWLCLCWMWPRFRMMICCWEFVGMETECWAQCHNPSGCIYTAGLDD